MTREGENAAKREIWFPILDDLNWADIQGACIDLDIEPEPTVIAAHPRLINILRRARELASMRRGGVP